MNSLENIQWIQPLIKKIKANGGVCNKNKPLLFELRFAAELHYLGLSPNYEYKTGVDDSTVDFRINRKDGFSWLVELVSIEISDAVKRATEETEVCWTTLLHSDAEDKTQSVEGEIIKAQEKIVEKVYSNGKITKFPPASDVCISLILADMRGCLLENTGYYDYLQIAYGAKGLRPEHECPVYFWKDRNGTFLPIKGIFEEDNPLKGSTILQQRIHFLGFVNEKEYGLGELLNQIQYFPNPNLFDNDKSVQLIYNQMPFRRGRTNAIQNKEPKDT
jgi:hypothetical protein